MTDAADTVRDLVLARRGDDSLGVRLDDDTWTWAEHTAAAARRARWLAARDLAAPGHVGVLLDNVPELSFLLAAGALAGIPVVGLNPTRTGAAFARDVARTDCRLILTATTRRGHLDGLELPPVVDTDDDGYLDEIARHDPTPPAGEVPADRTFMLILTSGTTGAPKAVVCSQGKIASQGGTLADMVGLTGDDVAYCAMPLFHSNAVIAAWTPAVASGASIALRESFSASQFLPDVRRYGATYANYVGTPLSYVLAQPRRDDDADNPLEVVFGNEAAPADVDRFAERFDCRVVEAYGSTEGGINLVRTEDTPPGAMGVPIGAVAIVDPVTGERCAVARFDDDGRLRNPDEAIGEMVNTDGRGSFEGYWDDDEAERERLRNGWFWSGDLAFRDDDGFFYFAGRSGSWLRVDGENFAAAPVERILARHPAVVESAVYGVPDRAAGDRVMAALAVTDGGELDPGRLVEWCGRQDDLGPKWIPTYLRIAEDLPRTGTNKLDRRALEQQAWLAEGVLVRDGDTYRPMTEADVAALHAALVDNGRGHLRPRSEEP